MYGVSLGLSYVFEQADLHPVNVVPEACAAIAQVTQIQVR